MAKKVMAVVKLQLPAGKATPAAPVGTTLGPLGINIAAFSKEYNEKTAHQAGSVVPAEVTVYSDRSFVMRLLTPPAGDLLRKAAGISKGASTPARTTVGQITRAKLRELAEIKMADLNAVDIEGAEKTLAGTARSMGIKIVD